MCARSIQRNYHLNDHATDNIILVLRVNIKFNFWQERKENGFVFDMKMKRTVFFWTLSKPKTIENPMLNWIHNELKRRFNFEQTKFRWRWMYWSLLVLQKCGCPKIDKNISENCVFYVPWFDCLDSRISRDYRHQCHPSMLGSEKRNYLKGNTRTEIFSFNFRWQKLFWMTATKAATVLVNLSEFTRLDNKK